MTTNTTGTRDLLPAWFEEFKQLYISGAGCCFLFCGDIHGTAAQGISQLRFLQTLLAARFEIVAYYHRAAGITFLFDETMRPVARTLLGSFAPTTDDDPLSLALEASGVMAAQQRADAFSAARKPKQALAVLERLLRAREAKERVAVVIDCADYLCPPANKATMSPDALDILAALQFWGSDRTLIDQSNPIFLLTRRLSDVHEDLRDSDSGYKVLDLALPDERTRLAYVIWYQHQRMEKEKPPIPLVDLTLEDFARITAGINLQHIEDILLLGAMVEQEEQGPGGVTRMLVKARKDAIIASKYSEIATMLEPLPGGFDDLGGMEHLIALTREHILRPLQEGRRQDVFSRLLLAGPPGTGKTYYAQALAREIGFSALSLNMENILDRFVGSSERNLKEFFQFARALAPVLIFLDEADQTEFSSRGNMSGNPAAGNLFSAMLKFAGDPSLRGRVILVMASNRPDLLDPALLRRMEAIIPVLLANDDGRRRILEKQAQAQGVTIADDALSLLARQADRYSASDLSALVREARWQTASQGRSLILVPDAALALDNVRPVTREHAEWFTLKAVDACNNRRFCPPEYAELWLNRGALQQQLKATEQEQPLPGPRQSRRW